MWPVAPALLREGGFDEWEIPSPAGEGEGGRRPGEGRRGKGPFDVLDHATSEIASVSKLGIDATKKLPGEGFKRSWPPLIKMDEAVRNRINQLFEG